MKNLYIGTLCRVVEGFVLVQNILLLGTSLNGRYYYNVDKLRGRTI